MSTATPLRIHKSNGRAADVAKVEQALTQGPQVEVEVADAKDLRRVLGIAQELGLEVEDRGGITWHAERLLEQTHGKASRRSSAHGVLSLRSPSIALPPGCAQGIAEAPDLGPRARILIYSAGATPDATRWVAVEA